MVETVTGAIESMEESQPQLPQTYRVYGTLSKAENGKPMIDTSAAAESGENPEGAYSGEIVLNLPDDVYILDASTGMPVALEDIEEGQRGLRLHRDGHDHELPPQTTAEMILVNIPADSKAPDYRGGGFHGDRRGFRRVRSHHHGGRGIYAL